MIPQIKLKGLVPDTNKIANQAPKNDKTPKEPN